MPKKNTSDDVEIQEGRVVSIGEDANKMQDYIIGHPDSVPVMVVAMLHGDVGVRVYGPPSHATLEILEQVVDGFRLAVAHAEMSADPKKMS